MAAQIEDTVADVLLIASDRFAAHEPPAGHPERVDRSRVMTAVAKEWVERGGQLAEPVQASTHALGQVHTLEYIESIVSTAGRSVRLDPDTYASPESEDVARYAAGAAIAAVDHALGSGRRAMAFVRPPGHHAEEARAMGFCLYNNIAVAAAHARSGGLNRVAIVDYDVHHGNGTQWAFYEDPAVLFISLHQYPFYPGTGAADDVGSAGGAGFTVNVPLEAGAGDVDYVSMLDRVVLPVLESYGPEMVLVSAGFDAHARDPLGGMQVSTAGYTDMTRRLCAFADRHCEGRVVGVTEGGYDLEALEACLQETLQVFAGQQGAAPEALRGPTTRADTAFEAVRRSQAEFWPGL